MVVKDDKFQTDNSTSLEKSFRWLINTSLSKLLFSSGLQKASELLLLEKTTLFQSDALHALKLYSKSSLCPETEEKLIYTFAAIEQLLLKDRSELITINVAERLAFCLGGKISEISAISENTLQVYDFRSSFVHHGQMIEPEQKEKIKQFMYNSWKFLTKVLVNVDRIESKLQLIEEIDKVRLKASKIETRGIIRIEVDAVEFYWSSNVLDEHSKQIDAPTVNYSKVMRGLGFFKASGFKEKLNKKETEAIQQILNKVTSRLERTSKEQADIVDQLRKGAVILEYHPDYAAIKIMCRVCARIVNVQANFNGVPLQNDFIPFPKDNVLGCLHCSSKMDGSKLRQTIEAKANKTILQ